MKRAKGAAPRDEGRATAGAEEAHPRTPDGRYFVVRGRLWRLADPALPDEERTRLVRKLMRARRDIATARRTADADLARRARRRVHEAKAALGERGRVWWTDGAPDYNRRLVVNTPYAAWFARRSR